MELRLLLLETLAGVPAAPVIYRIALATLFLAFLVAAIWQHLPRAKVGVVDHWFARPIVFYAVAAAFIVVARLPGLLPPLLNVDEGLFTAAAARLLDDPVFWRAVDTGSSGPVNIYPLALASAVGLRLDLASSRLIGLLFMTASSLLTFAALGQVVSQKAARTAMLPVVPTIALMQQPDFVHYSGEHIPIFLLCGMIFLLFRLGARGRLAHPPAQTIVCIGLLAGLMPYAKLQGAPIALVVCLTAVHLLWTQYRADRHVLGRQVAWLVVGGLIPSLLVMGFLQANSIGLLFWHSYVQTNLFFYAGLRSAGLWPMSKNFVALLAGAPALYPLILATIVVCAAGLWHALSARLRPSLQAVHRRPYVAYASAYLAAAAFAAAKPGNAFPHYLLFLIMPMGLLIGTILGEADRDGGLLPIGKTSARAWRSTAAAMLVLSAVIPVANRAAKGSLYLKDTSQFLMSYRDDVMESIRRTAAPGSSMSVWGFSPGLFIESGMAQATRYGCTLWQIETSPLQDDFINEWVIDFERARPLVFVDAMAPGMFYPTPVDRTRQGHDAFARVAEVVSRNYDLVDEVQGVRIYRRRVAK